MCFIEKIDKCLFKSIFITMDKEKDSVLARFGRDLTALAEKNKLDPVIGKRYTNSSSDRSFNQEN